ncbi:hypothetical protein FHY18_004080 [Xanthomonas arboricola]|nr:hypothetical protein [Xanthomonas sp. 3793]
MWYVACLRDACTATWLPMQPLTKWQPQRALPDRIRLQGTPQACTAATPALNNTLHWRATHCFGLLVVSRGGAFFT